MCSNFGISAFSRFQLFYCKPSNMCAGYSRASIIKSLCTPVSVDSVSMSSSENVRKPELSRIWTNGHPDFGPRQLIFLLLYWILKPAFASFNPPDFLLLINFPSQMFNYILCKFCNFVNFRYFFVNFPSQIFNF